MDAKKVVIGALLLVLVLFLVFAGPSCGDESAEAERRKRDDFKAKITYWKERIDEWFDEGPSLFAPAPLCARSLVPREAGCPIRGAGNLDLPINKTCRYTLSAASDEQRRGEFQFRAAKADRITARSSDPELLKVVLEDTEYDKKEQAVLLIAPPHDDERARVTLTLKCGQPLVGSICRLRYVVEDPEPCANQSP